MLRKLLILTQACLTVVLFAGAISANEVDELREKAEAIQRESKVLREEGKTEPADQLASQAEELLQKAQDLESNADHEMKDTPDHASDAKKHTEVDPAKLIMELESLQQKQKDMEKGNAQPVALKAIRREIRFIKETLARTPTDQARTDEARIDKERAELSRELDRQHELLRKKEEAQAPEEELREIHNQIRALKLRLSDLTIKSETESHNRKHVEQRDLISRRLHHIRVAAENLKLAEMHDLALKLTLETEALERHLDEMRRHDDHPHSDREVERNKDLHHMMKELKSELHLLREEVREIRDQKHAE